MKSSLKELTQSEQDFLGYQLETILEDFKSLLGDPAHYHFFLELMYDYPCDVFWQAREQFAQSSEFIIDEDKLDDKSTESQSIRKEYLDSLVYLADYLYGGPMARQCVLDGPIYRGTSTIVIGFDHAALAFQQVAQKHIKSIIDHINASQSEQNSESATQTAEVKDEETQIAVEEWDQKKATYREKIATNLLLTFDQCKTNEKESVDPVYLAASEIFIRTSIAELKIRSSETIIKGVRRNPGLTSEEKWLINNHEKVKEFWEALEQNISYLQVWILTFQHDIQSKDWLLNNCQQKYDLNVALVTKCDLLAQLQFHISDPAWYLAIEYRVFDVIRRLQGSPSLYRHAIGFIVNNPVPQHQPAEYLDNLFIDLAQRVDREEQLATLIPLVAITGSHKACSFILKHTVWRSLPLSEAGVFQVRNADLQALKYAARVGNIEIIEQFLRKFSFFDIYVAAALFYLYKYGHFQEGDKCLPLLVDQTTEKSIMLQADAVAYLREVLESLAYEDGLSRVERILFVLSETITNDPDERCELIKQLAVTNITFPILSNIEALEEHELSPEAKAVLQSAFRGLCWYGHLSLAQLMIAKKLIQIETRAHGMLMAYSHGYMDVFYWLKHHLSQNASEQVVQDSIGSVVSEALSKLDIETANALSQDNLICLSTLIKVLVRIDEDFEEREWEDYIQVKLWALTQLLQPGSRDTLKADFARNNEVVNQALSFVQECVEEGFSDSAEKVVNYLTVREVSDHLVQALLSESFELSEVLWFKVTAEETWSLLATIERTSNDPLVRSRGVRLSRNTLLWLKKHVPEKGESAVTSFNQFVILKWFMVSSSSVKWDNLWLVGSDQTQTDIVAEHLLPVLNSYLNNKQSVKSRDGQRSLRKLMRYTRQHRVRSLPPELLEPSFNFLVDCSEFALMGKLLAMVANPSDILIKRIEKEQDPDMQRFLKSKVTVYQLEKQEDHFIDYYRAQERVSLLLNSVNGPADIEFFFTDISVTERAMYLDVILSLTTYVEPPDIDINQYVTNAGYFCYYFPAGELEHFVAFSVRNIFDRWGVHCAPELIALLIEKQWIGPKQFISYIKNFGRISKYDVSSKRLLHFFTAAHQIISIHANDGNLAKQANEAFARLLISTPWMDKKKRLLVLDWIVQHYPNALLIVMSRCLKEESSLFEDCCSIINKQTNWHWDKQAFHYLFFLCRQFRSKIGLFPLGTNDPCINANLSSLLRLTGQNTAWKWFSKVTQAFYGWKDSRYIEHLLLVLEDYLHKNEQALVETISVRQIPLDICLYMIVDALESQNTLTTLAILNGIIICDRFHQQTEFNNEQIILAIVQHVMDSGNDILIDKLATIPCLKPLISQQIQHYIRYEVDLINQEQQDKSQGYQQLSIPKGEMIDAEIAYSVAEDIVCSDYPEVLALLNLGVCSDQVLSKAIWRHVANSLGSRPEGDTHIIQQTIERRANFINVRELWQIKEFLETPTAENFLPIKNMATRRCDEVLVHYKQQQVGTDEVSRG